MTVSTEELSRRIDNSHIPSENSKQHSHFTNHWAPLPSLPPYITQIPQVPYSGGPSLNMWDLPDSPAHTLGIQACTAVSGNSCSFFKG